MSITGDLLKGLQRQKAILPLHYYLDTSITLGRFRKVELGDNLGHLLPGNWEVGFFFLDDYIAKR